MRTFILPADPVGGRVTVLVLPLSSSTEVEGDAVLLTSVAVRLTVLPLREVNALTIGPLLYCSMNHHGNIHTRCSVQ